jgi:RNA polymerase sigma-70 factor (ECF subfamily)
MVESPVTRASLLLRLRNPHDAVAWREFLELYAPLVYGYARKQGLQDADAADLCQEVLRAVAGAIGRLDYDPGRGSFRNWLFTIVRRKLSNWRVARNHRPLGTGDPQTQVLLQQYPAAEVSETDWESQWQRRTFDWACVQVRAEVKELTWQAFWRTAIDGQGCPQVARDLGLSIGAVYHARSRVLSRLREHVQSIQEP